MADTTVRLSSTQSLHLIELYHGHDALWNICSPQYNDRNVRNAAYIQRRGNDFSRGWSSLVCDPTFCRWGSGGRCKPPSESPGANAC